MESDSSDKPAGSTALATCHENNLQTETRVMLHRTLSARPMMLGFLALFAGAAFGQSTPAANVLHTRALAATCANCHGTDGRAVQGQAMATLAGRSKDEIMAQMKAFRDGSRPATVMHQLTKGYSNEQIEAIAAYFAAIK